VFAPRADGDDWFCAYEIGWPDGVKAGTASGYDSAQALLHALQMIGADIYSSDYHRAGQLMWTDPQDGYGFPVPTRLRDLLIGDDAEYL
jgi:hypothetical protein